MVFFHAREEDNYALHESSIRTIKIPLRFSLHYFPHKKDREGTVFTGVWRLQGGTKVPGFFPGLWSQVLSQGYPSPSQEDTNRLTEPNMDPFMQFFFLEVLVPAFHNTGSVPVFIFIATNRIYFRNLISKNHPQIWLRIECYNWKRACVRQDAFSNFLTINRIKMLKSFGDSCIVPTIL